VDLLTPGDHKTSQIERRAQPLHENVQRNIKNDVGNEKYEQCNVVIVALHVEIGFESLNSCIANGSSIEECDNEERTKHGHEVQIGLDSDFVLGLVVDVLKLDDLLDFEADVFFLELCVARLDECGVLGSHCKLGVDGRMEEPFEFQAVPRTELIWGAGERFL
jgi:hypothetical protein